MEPAGGWRSQLGEGVLLQRHEIGEEVGGHFVVEAVEEAFGHEAAADVAGAGDVLFFGWSSRFGVWRIGSARWREAR